MNMKLSYRDKVIFIVVMVILVLVAGFFLLIKPKFEAVDSAKYNLEQKQNEWTDLENKIATYPDIVKGMKANLETISEQQKVFLENSYPYLNERYIREALAEVNVEVKSVTTQYTTANPLEKYLIEPKNILAYENQINADIFNTLPQEVYDEYNGVEEESANPVIVGETIMSISFDSDIALRDAYNVIDRIAEDEKSIVLNTISSTIEESSSDPTQSLTSQITLYSIFPLDTERLKDEPETIEEAVEAAKKAATEVPAAE